MKQIISYFQTWSHRYHARKVTMERAKKRVKRGATYLDDVDPSWYRRINADTLELASGESCILGQLHGDFKIGLTRARLFDLSSAPRANLSPVAFGFHCHYNVGEELQQEDYDNLTSAWREAIRERQNRDISSGDSYNLPGNSGIHLTASTPSKICNPQSTTTT